MTSHSDEITAPWIYTYSGQKVNLLEPDPNTIRVEDIAHALANIGRWGGHTSFYWSVAQHSVLVSRYCDPKDAKAGLFHDAAEAYLGDICRPLKRSPVFREYREVYRQMERIILFKFCGVTELPESVIEADERILATEMRLLMRRWEAGHAEDAWLGSGEPLDITIEPENPMQSRQGFLQRYWRLAALNEGYSV